MWSKVRNNLGDETGTGRRDRHCVTDVTAQLLTLKEKWSLTFCVQESNPWPLELLSSLLANWPQICLFCVCFSQKTTTTYFQPICSPGLVKIQTGQILHFPLLSAVLLSHWPQNCESCVHSTTESRPIKVLCKHCVNLKNSNNNSINWALCVHCGAESRPIM